MFLSILNSKEKIAFLSLAKKLIISDEHIAENEKVLYHAMQQEMEILEDIMEDNISEEEIDKLPDDIPHLCDVFTSKKSKISALMELIALGFVDGKFVAQEQKIIYEVAEHFGISHEETMGYIEWANRLYFHT